MTDNTRDTDAERLALFHYRFVITDEKGDVFYTDVDTDECFLLRQIDTRDAALREAQQGLDLYRVEVSRFQTELAERNTALSEARKKIERLKQALTTIEQETIERCANFTFELIIRDPHNTAYDICERIRALADRPPEDKP